MIVRHSGRATAPRKKAPRAVVARTSLRSSMGSDGDDSEGSDGRGGYSDDSEAELEAGCMGVKDPREQKKKERYSAQEHFLTFLCMLALLGLGAFLPYFLLAASDLWSNAADAGAKEVPASLGDRFDLSSGAPGTLNGSATLNPVAAVARPEIAVKSIHKAPSPPLNAGPWVRPIRKWMVGH